MSDDLVLDIVMDTQNDPNPPETLKQQHIHQITPPFINVHDSNNLSNDSTRFSHDSPSKKDKLAEGILKKEKGKKKKEKEQQKDEKEKKKKDSKDDETDLEKEKTVHANDSDDDKTDNNANNEDINGEKKERKKKKNKENKNDKPHLDPSAPTIAPTIEYVSTSGHHYELIKVQPKGKYDVKMHMTNERTFFKYLFASFHLGAMGTFLLQYYSQPSFYKPVLIGFIWLTAFSFVCVGLYTYYQRRQFLQKGKMKQINGLQIHGPTYVLIFFFLVFITILLYSVENLPTAKTKLQLEGSYAQHQTNTPTPFTTLLPVG